MNTATDPAPNAPLTVIDCARTCGEDWAAITHDSAPWTSPVPDADLDWTEEQLGRRLSAEETADFAAAFRAQYNAKVGAVEVRLNWHGRR